jgi:hypothetical protein
VRRPKLEAWIGIIDQILEEDRSRPAKQRHSALRIWQRLRDEYAFPGCYTIVNEYVRHQKLSQREMLVPLAHPPGHAQADFGEALVVIGGQEQKEHYFCLDLPQSDDCFVVRFRPKRRKLFWKDMSRHLRTWAARHKRFCTTTRSWQWRRSWATACADGRKFQRTAEPLLIRRALRPAGQRQ